MNYFAIDPMEIHKNTRIELHGDDFLSKPIKENSAVQSVNRDLPVSLYKWVSCDDIVEKKTESNAKSESFERNTETWGVYGGVNGGESGGAGSTHTLFQSENILPPPPVSNHTLFNSALHLNKPDRIGLVHNHIKESIYNNDPIEPQLHVIAVISNICLFKKRYTLMKDFIKRMEFEKNVILYIVELAYGNQEYAVTSPKHPHHLQLRTEYAIWHKENMINLGVQKLLPSNWKAFAWIDGDIEFENPDWANDTLKILNGSRDIVQLFSHALDMDASQNILNVFNSFSHQYEKNLNYSYKAPNYWHPGYAWACTRKAYEKMGGIFEYGILGSGDYIMASCLMNKGLSSISPQYSNVFKQKICDYESKVKHLRLGYVPGVIRHFFHGSKINRKYVERNTILFKHQYDPAIHLIKDKNGVLTGSAHFSAEFKKDMYEYFAQRNEDE